MVVLDTCSFIFDALAPEKLSKLALRTIQMGEKDKSLYCSDITLWEVAMLIYKKRLDPGTSVSGFLQLAISARQIQILNILPEIAALSVDSPLLEHYSDPADRLIAATALYHRAGLVTYDKKMLATNGLHTIW